LRVQSSSPTLIKILKHYVRLEPWETLGSIADPLNDNGQKKTPAHEAEVQRVTLIRVS
jgi:hypothetical protein